MVTTSVFRQKFVFGQKFGFLIKNSVFGQKFGFWSKIRFVVKKFGFWSKNLVLANKFGTSILDRTVSDVLAASYHVLFGHDGLEIVI